MKVTKNPFDKFTENCLTHFVFALATFTWGGMGGRWEGHMYSKIKNCIQIFQMMATHITDRTIKRKLGRATDHMFCLQQATAMSWFVRSLPLAEMRSLHLGGGLFLMLQIKTRDALLGESFSPPLCKRSRDPACGLPLLALLRGNTKASSVLYIQRSEGFSLQIH